MCWDGGELLCCDHCPAAYHPECLGYTPAEMKQLERKRWACPHHSCTKCDRNTGRAGGLLFRCARDGAGANCLSRVGHLLSVGMGGSYRISKMCVQRAAQGCPGAEERCLSLQVRDVRERLLRGRPTRQLPHGEGRGERGGGKG